jgi:hypothetical protein
VSEPTRIDALEADVAGLHAKLDTVFAAMAALTARAGMLTPLEEAEQAHGAGAAVVERIGSDAQRLPRPAYLSVVPEAGIEAGA